ncbi:DUF5960 family protein [Enterococcus mundtii]|uniref:DUF5960 family protein n=2 Tax=Enterococcus mundtii TaxID=53346 RepID=UPI00032F2D34|nr:DUF5960 family protein [Enterococcus mundtii]EOH63842.1 hypothetical protein UAC_00761 [Enterococcus mundtii ATCC 882]EOU13520.1 hypothetical protein I587_02071 [Enterococcus mundtii ATCC 882]PJK24485.1 hypothetical protein CV769_15230 [Enterococcus mundtii]
MIIHKNVMLWFFHDPKKKFEKELYKYWNSEIDFKLVENMLLVHLYESNKNYFMLPASKTKNNMNVYFLFDIVADVPNTRMQHRRYDFRKRLFINPKQVELS